MPGFFRVVVLALLVVFTGSCSSDRQGPAGVATANKHASEAAALMLKKGGSAIDAMIAAQLVLGLVEPQSSGIGGGAFILYWQADKRRLTTYDGREKAPMAVDENLFMLTPDKPMHWRVASVGGRAVGVPGLVAAMYKAHKGHGHLKWSELFEPAVKLAQEGFEVSPRLHAAIKRGAKALLKDDEARQTYFLEGTDQPVPVGHLLKVPAYARTLQLVAEKGPDGFYKGEVAQAIIAKVTGHKTNPGKMTLEDLTAYQAVERAPVCGPYRAFKVCGMGPPTSGGLTSLMILGLLEPYSMGRLRPGSPAAMHLFTQASRLAYADRGRYMGDADFVTIPMAGLLQRNYLRQRAALINPVKDSGKALPGVPPGTSEKNATGPRGIERGTSHLSIIDQWGNAVSMTTSVERGMGAHIMAAGFILNNQLTDFSFRPKVNGRPVANRVEPGKRPRSSMSPTMIFTGDGRLFATLGSPGGSRIIEYVTRSVIGLVDWNLSMQAAFDLPNVNNRNWKTEVEDTPAGRGLADGLKKHGQKPQIKPLNSGLHGIRIVNGKLDGGADRRREGTVIILGTR